MNTTKIDLREVGKGHGVETPYSFGGRHIDHVDWQLSVVLGNVNGPVITLSCRNELIFVEVVRHHLANGRMHSELNLNAFFYN